MRAIWGLGCAVMAMFAAGQESSQDRGTRTLLVLGDSLAAGYGVEPGEAFPARLQELIRQAGLGFTVVNAGVSGDTSAGGLRRLNWLLRRPVDVLVLELGGNDGLRGVPPEATRTNLQAIIDRTRDKHPQVKVVIAGMRMPDNLGREYGAEFQAVFTELAAANQAVLIPFLLEGIAGDPRFNLPDLIHPNPVGHQLVASNVWQAVQPVLREFATSGDAKTVHAGEAR